MKWKVWIYGAAHVLVFGVVAYALWSVFPPVARFMQSLVGELTIPQHVSTPEERLYWEMVIQRGYGEGVNTVANLLFVTLGILIPGIIVALLALPGATKSDPELDPTLLPIPVGARSAIILGSGITVLVIISLIFDNGSFLASGFGLIGIGGLPYLAMSILSLYVGVYIWKRLNWKDDFVIDDDSNNDLSKFYNKLKTQ